MAPGTYLQTQEHLSAPLFSSLPDPTHPEPGHPMTRAAPRPSTEPAPRKGGAEGHGADLPAIQHHLRPLADGSLQT